MSTAVRWLIYRSSWALAWVFTRLYFRQVVKGREQLPKKGGVLLISNHQSYLDPLILGSATWRQCSFVARDDLGRIPLVGLWMRAVGVIHVNRDAPGRSSLGRIIDALGEGRLVPFFPEGTRSKDGRLGSFKRGLALLLKKSGATVVPVGIRGSFVAFPPGAVFPRPRHCAVHFGSPMSAAELLAQGGLENLRQQVAQLCGTLLADEDDEGSPGGLRAAGGSS